MKILVCVKQVPDAPAEAVLSKNMDRRRLSQGINMADRAALEAALCLREEAGGSVTLLSLGLPAAKMMLREHLQLGADRAILITDPRFAGSDTLATARALSTAAERLGGFDLVLTGRRAADGETGHICPEIAAMLGATCLTNAIRLETGGAGLVCERLLEDRVQTLSLPLPATVSVSGGYLLRPPSIAGIREARNKQVTILTAADLGLTPEQVGAAGSATEVVRVWRAERPEGRCRMYGDMESGVSAVLSLLRRPHKREGYAAESPPTPAAGTALVVSFAADAQSAAYAAQLFGAAKRVCRNVRLVSVENAGPDDGPAAESLAGYIETTGPDLVLFPATIRGRATAPMVAARLGIGLTADCTGITRGDDGIITMTRPTFGGSVMAEIVCTTGPAMASVHPGIFAAEAGLPEAERLVAEAGTVRLLWETGADVPDLWGSAGVIVSGGRGVGGKEGFRKLGGLAELLDGALAGSRGAVDDGMISYPHQVGQTGAAVRPDVYIACGISGSVQHMAGVMARSIIAVNTDPKAPIFDYAELGILGDCQEFATKLAEAIRAGGYKNEL